MLVAIDSETISEMKERWPYSRATFAKVLTHLKEAGARAIGLDFSFFGDSRAEEDRELAHLLTNEKKIILPATLKEGGGIRFSTFPGLQTSDSSGILNKLQDPDGVTRRTLTYLVNTNPKISQQRFFSWEMKLWEAGGKVNLAQLEEGGKELTFGGSHWRIPVDPVTKTFPIRFRAQSRDFERLSFSKVLTKEFDPKLVQDKIVLIGFLTVLLQDLHLTPIGWLPGLTLNANSLLTLYANDFLKPVPRWIEKIVTAMGIFLTALFASFLKVPKATLWAALVIVVFFLASYFLFYLNYTWNYALFPFGVLATLFLPLSSFIYKRR